MPALSGLHHVAITVRDRDVSAHWYHDLLGFEELFREDAPFDPHRLGLDHLAFAVPTREAMNEWAATLLAAGVQHSGVIDVGPRSILNFKDPDGIALAVFWDEPA